MFTVRKIYRENFKPNQIEAILRKAFNLNEEPANIWWLI